MSLNCPQLIEIRLEKIPIVCDSDFPKDQKKKTPLPLELNLPSCQRLCVECKLLQLSVFSKMKQVRKLKLLDVIPGKGQPFITILSGFLDIEELSIDSDCFQDTATGEVAQTLSLPLEKLKNVVIDVSGFGEKEIAMIGCLLRSASSLQTMTLILPECLKGIHDRNFANQVLDLKRSSAEKHGNAPGGHVSWQKRFRNGNGKRKRNVVETCQTFPEMPGTFPPLF
ncbi:hypothetical protein KI387_021859 [Taxus chinensis]|uniref:FBD domain-containing protein n=1 Tax=Taxus chinensis TaxID=29808 RepID=A0AA38LFG0_TAXCH|nr:hypothetical protein KI387_021859 [Taxus chinensis]